MLVNSSHQLSRSAAQHQVINGGITTLNYVSDCLHLRRHEEAHCQFVQLSPMPAWLHALQGKCVHSSIPWRKLQGLG